MEQSSPISCHLPGPSQAAREKTMFSVPGADETNRELSIQSGCANASLLAPLVTSSACTMYRTRSGVWLTIIALMVSFFPGPCSPAATGAFRLLVAQHREWPVPLPAVAILSRKIKHGFPKDDEQTAHKKVAWKKNAALVRCWDTDRGRRRRPLRE